MKNADIRFWNYNEFCKVDECSYKLIQSFIEHKMIQKEKLLFNNITISGYNDMFINERQQIEDLFKAFNHYQISKCDVFYAGGCISYTFNEENKDEVFEALKEDLKQVFEELEEMGYEPIELFEVKSTDTVQDVLEKIEQYIVEYMTSKQNGCKEWIYSRTPKIMLHFKAEGDLSIIMKMLGVTNIAINFYIEGEEETSIFYMREVEHSGEREEIQLYVSNISESLNQSLVKIVEEYNLSAKTPARCGLSYDEF